MLKAHALPILVALVISTALYAGKPVKRITEFEAADVTFAENANDVVRSDGLGAYLTGVDGFEAYSEYDRSQLASGERPFVLSLGTVVSGDASIDPSGPITSVSMRHLVESHTTEDLDASYPSPGTSITSNADQPHSIYFLFTAADGAVYWIDLFDDTGGVSLTGHDFDGDGKNDARSIQVSPTLVWTLYVQTTETVEVVVGKGKNKTTETQEQTTFVPVAEYTGMSLAMRFDLVGFRISQF